MVICIMIATVYTYRPSRRYTSLFAITMLEVCGFLGSHNALHANDSGMQLSDAANGFVRMTGARHDGTGDCSCNLIPTQWRKREAQGTGCRVHAASSYCRIGNDGLFAERTKARHRRQRPHDNYVGCSDWQGGTGA